MANIVFNYLKVNGVDNCELFRKYALKDNQFSFENIEPTPKELENTECGTVSFGAEHLINDPKNHKVELRRYTAPPNNFYISVIHASNELEGDDITDLMTYIVKIAQETDDVGELYFYAKRYFRKIVPSDYIDNLMTNVTKYIDAIYAYYKTGYTSCYDWRIAKWGCKWDADEVVIEADLTEEGKESAIYISFQTPWDTPRAVLTTLTKKGVEFTNMYGDEGSTNYCGIDSYEVDWYGEITVDDVKLLLWYAIVYFGCLDIEELKILLGDEYLENDTVEDIGINDEAKCKDLQEIFDEYWF
jgi:hypothetical protein